MDSLAGMSVFIRVVETGSFSRAATELGTTQPTATKAVAAAEKRLGARLLHRTTRGVTPTEVGALYYERCKLIVREVEAAENLAALKQGGIGGTLRISTSVAFGRRVMVPLVLRYMREQPHVAVDLSFDDRYVNLVEQGIDVAIRTPSAQCFNILPTVNWPQRGFVSGVSFSVRAINSARAPSSQIVAIDRHSTFS